MDKLNASEALFGFMGWLTCLEESVTFGAVHDASKAAELVDQYCKAHDLEPPRKDFQNRLVSMPGQFKLRP